MFAADAALEVLARAAALEHRLADELAHAVAVENLERVVLEDALLEVDGQELADVVARESERHLRQVVRAEREELGDLGDLVGRDGRARHFDHRADHVFDLVVALREDLFGRRVDDLLLVAQLLVVAHQRNHDLHVYGHARSLDVHRRLDDGARLHLRDFGVGVAQTAAAVAQHGVELGQRLDLGDDLLKGYVHFGGHLALSLLVVGHELVQRGIEQAHRHGESVHGLEQPFEVAPLHRQQLAQCHAAARLVVGEDHLADGLDAVALEEHVLRAAEADALGAELEGLPGVLRRVGVGAHLQHGVLPGQLHELAEVAAQVGGLRGHLTQIDLARRAVERDPVALLDREAVHLDRAGLVVDLQLAGARDAAFAHAARHDGRVRGHAAARREDSGRVEHALQVLGRGLDAHQDRLLARPGQLLLGILGEEHHGTRRRTRRGGQPLRDDLGRSDGLLVEYGVQQLVELRGFAAQHGGLFVDQPLAQHVHGDLDHRCARALAVAALEHPELAVLDRELDVLHVLEVLLEVVLNLVQLLVDRGHHLLERGVFRGALRLRNVLRLGPALRAFDRDLLRGADAGHDVLSLRIDQVLSVEDVLARRGVARESHARGRVLTHVAEDHGLHRNGRSPLGGDVVELAVEDGALVHPRAEHGAHGAPQLLPGAGGEILAGLPLHGLLEAPYQFLQVVGGQVRVVLHAAPGLQRVDDLLERIVVLLRDGLHAQHHVAVHLHETAVRVPCEARIARAFRNGLHGLVVHAEVEDRVHHARHRGARARTHGDEQRRLRVAELHARQAFDVVHRLLDLGAEHLDHGLLAVSVILRAYLRGDREARGNGDADEVHLREVRTLAAEQLTHFAVAFGLLVAEGIDSFNVCHNFSI